MSTVRRLACDFCGFVDDGKRLLCRSAIDAAPQTCICEACVDEAAQALREARAKQAGVTE